MLISLKQESRAIAKITARCVQCMGALKMFETSCHGYFSKNF